MSSDSRVVLKLGRIHQDSRGNVQFGRAAVMAGPKPGSRDEDLWWLDVLHDRRARYPQAGSIEKHSADSLYRLDRFRHEDMTLQCHRCSATQMFSKSKLRETFGDDANTIVLAREIRHCPHRSRDGNFCLAYFRR